MLDKLLAGNSQNPHYLADLNKFAKSVSKEKLIRGFGFALVIIALVLQLLAVFLPNKVAATPSPNDLIPGGVSSKKQLVHACQDNTNNIKPILTHYGIDCSDLADGAVVSLNSTDYNKKLYSVGHLAYGLPGETPVNISGRTVYWRLLHGWDTHGSSTYTALKFKNSQNKVFFSLFTCGNLVSIGLPNAVVPPAPTPKPTVAPKPAPVPSPTPKTTPTPTPTPSPTPTPTPTPVPTPSTPSPTPTPASTPSPTLCQYNNQLLASDANCKPCSSSASQFDSLACLLYHKSTSNLSLTLGDANNSTAGAGNVLEYKLVVANSGKLTASDFVIKDNITDILDYADVTDYGGGTLDSDGFLSYPAVSIKPGEKATASFKITIKNPVPTTAPPANDPQKYNSVMTNVFGDTINVKVQQPPPQVVVTTASTLPNTGPGISVLIYALAASVAGFLFHSRRLQLKEALIAIAIAEDKRGDFVHE